MRASIRSLVFSLLAASASIVSAGSGDGRLDIYWVDVEGGAATLIVTPAGESVLIDTGNPGYRDPNRIVQVITREAGLRRIDHLITTHYHRDHFGGAATLATLIPIGTVHDNGDFEGMPDDPGKPYREFESAARRVINPGDKISLRQGVKSIPLRLTCLGARKQFIKPAADAPDCESCAAHKSKDRDGSDNANSVVTVLDFGPFRFYDGGDLTWNQEFRLVCPKNVVGQVDVYQVTHHGLDSSNNPVILGALQPQVAIMNNGKTKGCLPDVFANLKATASLQAIYQLHHNERPDGALNNVADEFIANRTQEVTGNIIHLSVAKDGKSYDVRIPAHNLQKTYKTILNK
jgi:competence protein ComEC